MSQSPTVEEVLRAVPSHGWVGRRDRAILVLSQLAGMTFEDMAQLSASDISIAGGTARIRTPVATITLQADQDTVVCGPCALARWLHLLDMTLAYPDSTVPVAVLARGAPLFPDSPHACEKSTPTTQIDIQDSVTLLPAIDPWGILSAAPGTRLPRHQRSTRRNVNTSWQTHQTPAARLEQRIEQLLGSP